MFESYEKFKLFIVIFFSNLYSQKKEDFEYWVTEHLRISGFYWGLAAMDLMNALPQGAEKGISAPELKKQAFSNDMQIM